jgi:hypothetical protein
MVESRTSPLPSQKLCLASHHGSWLYFLLQDFAGRGALLVVRSLQGEELWVPEVVGPGARSCRSRAVARHLV